MFEKRSIGMCILLSIVTCGIYGIYWYYKVAEDFYNSNTPNNVGSTPGITILLTIVTCGIYGIYAAYKWGKQTPEIFGMYGQYAEDKSTLYLILSLIGLDWVVILLMQNDLNMLADTGMGGGTGGGYGSTNSYGNAPYGTTTQQSPSYQPPAQQPSYQPPAQPSSYQPPTYPEPPAYEPPPNSPYDPGRTE